MGLYIKGLRMPIEGAETIIRIQPDGRLLDQYGHRLLLKVFPVPPHGRLIDADALIDDMANMIPWAIESPEEIAMMDGLSAGYEAVKAAPTIIPAEPAEEGK